MPNKENESSKCPYLAKDRSLTPHCRWYQRESFVFLTVEVMDCQDPDISVMDNKLFFNCTGADLKKYELDLELLKDINTKASRYAVRPRVVEFKLEKREATWWDRLLKEKTRQHWLRVDFQNWKDEEDCGDDKVEFEEKEDYQPVTTDWSKHIAENVAKGSSLCPLGQAVMGGALNKGEGNVEGKVLSDGRVVPPTPAQQALNMKGLDIYSWDPTQPHSDDEPLSDLENMK